MKSTEDIPPSSTRSVREVDCIFDVCGDSMLYWTQVNRSRSRVMRCRLNGSDVTTVTTSIDSANGLYVDDRSASLYVLQGDNGALHRCQTLDHGQF